MPRPGLSLVGFYAEPEQALWHLRQDCVPPPDAADDAALLARWRQAQALLGPAQPGAGMPEVLPLPDDCAAYAEELARQGWMAETMATLPGARMALVELDRLACHQPTIATAHAEALCAGLPGTDPAALMPLCLPLRPPPLDCTATPVGEGSSGVLLRSPRGDFSIARFGVFGGGAGVMLAGARLAVLSPFVHVVLVGGRGFLLNGYHRAFGARLAGATHLPCVVSEAPGLVEAGVVSTDPAQDYRLPPALLTSANPPTLGHFTGGRALHVTLRRRARVVHVSWHAYTVDEE